MPVRRRYETSWAKSRLAYTGQNAVQPAHMSSPSFVIISMSFLYVLITIYDHYWLFWFSNTAVRLGVRTQASTPIKTCDNRLPYTTLIAFTSGILPWLLWFKNIELNVLALPVQFGINS